MGRKLVEWLTLHDSRVAHVIAVGRDGLHFETLKKELSTSKRIHFFPCDVTNTAEVQRIADTLKNKGLVPDLLVNNAAIIGPIDISRTRFEPLVH